MTMEEILAGESKNVEFKECLPERSIKYMKSVVDFANGTGGKIIFRITDKTREVVGLGEKDVYNAMNNAKINANGVENGVNALIQNRTKRKPNWNIRKLEVAAWPVWI